MLDHTGVVVSDLAASRRFYLAALAPLGLQLQHEIPAAVTGHVEVLGFGAEGLSAFWISPGQPNRPPLHLAFRAASRAQVDAFHQAALAAGGRDNGAPGPRPHYHPRYYGAFVLDPDGHNIEAVCRD